MKKIFILLLFLSKLVMAENGFFIKNNKNMNITNNIQNFNNMSPENIINFMKIYGSPYNEIISETNNLKLIADRIYIQNNKKILLIKVINKTNVPINVKQEINYGYPYPEIVQGNSYSWLIITNFPLEKPYKYDVKSFNEMLFQIITNKKLIYIRSYLINNPILVKLSFPNVAKRLTLSEFQQEIIGKGPFIAFTRIDREIDDETNRWGLFVNGFLRIEKGLWTPYTFYFIMKQGKIVKIIYIDKFLNFEQFKNLIYSSSH